MPRSTGLCEFMLRFGPVDARPPPSRQRFRPLVLFGVYQIGSMQVRTIMDSAEELAAISLLVDPVRWRLYDHVRSSRRAVGRDEAARAADISRNLASFHLDRMAEAGLLEVEYRRLSGRTGRGAGRPAKLYQVAARHFAVSLPATRYSLAGRILATAIEERRADEDGAAAVRRVAGRIGGEVGGELRQVAAGADAPLAVAEWATRQLGYEPEHHGDRIELRNCPFDELADSHLELICQMNRALIAGLLPPLGADEISAEPVQRRAGVSCCVQLTPSD
jgi:predicted ArsR family transcriptional regulator